MGTNTSREAGEEPEDEKGGNVAVEGHRVRDDHVQLSVPQGTAASGPRPNGEILETDMEPTIATENFKCSSVWLSVT